MRTLRGLAFLVSCLISPSATTAQAKKAMIDGVAVTTQVVASGLYAPVFLTSPKDDPRLFVIEQAGLIKIVENGAVLPKPFLDISNLISTDIERGLLGLAFDPDFATNGRFFIYFSDMPGDIQIASMQVSPDPNLADASSIKILLSIPHRSQFNHYGGWLGFGPDGLLYASVGDGGGESGDALKNAQNPEKLLGKILRIDVDHGEPYAIPPGNPFAQGGGAPEIFASGLRNPWRASFDGDILYIGDVGQDEWEEIDVLPVSEAGANFGWNRMEGLVCFHDKECDPSCFTKPIHVYGHDHGCAIIGGYVYRGKAIPALRGRYFFGDNCAGFLMSLRYKDGKTTDVINSRDDLGYIGSFHSFGTDSTGEIYLLADGKVLKIIPADK